ncbi:DotH/IcmK family type IV secretion protein [Coxiella-like endosymbiont of Rhipicephalus sanguineus]|uniref:DotH/IcmK family type IV secretion protein n=1 Tax=Coxiella-like endosymbiont of Rhipicephalus sanguineus TaxID=1955402 RepID=UPI00203AB5C8|nr:DotH/IcmK family type IV secretion protein [Coxiella-like endosymbiont of Rhipicephalus sanguineus]
MTKVSKWQSLRQIYPPKPTSASVIVNLSPEATLPVIRLSSGFVTSLVFLDSTGAPWPIQAYDLGDPNSFNIQWNKKDNTLLVPGTQSL